MLDKLIKNNKEERVIVAPYVNMYEQGNKIILAVEMPGADKASLDVHLDGNQLVIHALKNRDDVGKDYKLIYQERVPVEYERRFEINTQIERDNIDAAYKDGILSISLTKSEAAQPKKISIKT